MALLACQTLPAGPTALRLARAWSLRVHHSGCPGRAVDSEEARVAAAAAAAEMSSPGNIYVYQEDNASAPLHSA